MSTAAVPIHVLRAAPAVQPLRERVLDDALDIAAERGWDAVHLHEVAQRAGISLAELRRHCEHKDALAEVLFDRADRAMLALPDGAGWDALSPRQRLHTAISTWMEALRPHRPAVRAMLRYKLRPEHLHLQALGVMRISRTVQWLREVARLPSTGWQREAEEAALTATFLSTFAFWLAEGRTRSGLDEPWLNLLLGLCERAARRLQST